jgi:hypothetical protein
VALMLALRTAGVFHRLVALLDDFDVRSAHSVSGLRLHRIHLDIPNAVSALLMVQIQVEVFEENPTYCWRYRLKQYISSGHRRTQTLPRMRMLSSLSYTIRRCFLENTHHVPCVPHGRLVLSFTADHGIKRRVVSDHCSSS